MLKVITSVWLPVLLLPRISVEDSRKPALAPPNGTVFVNARDAPPLSEIRKSAEGILPPAPSVRAAAELLKYAYVVTNPIDGFNVQIVVAVIDVLPGLLALPEVKLKLTAFAES